jgi:STE24 endopeptidase
MIVLAAIGLITSPLQRNLTRFNEQQADMFALNAAREPDGAAEAAILLSEYRKMEPAPFEQWWFYTHPSGWNRVHNAMVWKAHEIAAGRFPNTPGGPPPGWVPDFVRNRGATNAEPAEEPAALPPSVTPEPSPAAPSN